MTQRPFPNVSELQLCEDGVNATQCPRDVVDVAVRESTRVVNHGDSFATVSVPHRGDVALKEDAFWDSQPTLCAKGLRVGDFGGVSLSSGFSSQLLWDSQDIPRSVELRQWWAEGGKDSSSQQLTGGSGGGMGGREVPFGERGVLDDIKAKQLGYGEKPDYIGVAATLNFVRSEKLWYEACASEGCQKKVVQNTDGTWMRARGVLTSFKRLVAVARGRGSFLF